MYNIPNSNCLCSLLFNCSKPSYIENNFIYNLVLIYSTSTFFVLAHLIICPSLIIALKGKYNLPAIFGIIIRFYNIIFFY